MTASNQILLFYSHDAGPYNIDTSPVSCSANQWTGFYMIETSVIKELNIHKDLHLQSKSIDWFL